jgi:hypothetical protein
LEGEAIRSYAPPPRFGAHGEAVLPFLPRRKTPGFDTRCDAVLGEAFVRIRLLCHLLKKLTAAYSSTDWLVTGPSIAGAKAVRSKPTVERQRGEKSCERIARPSKEQMVTIGSGHDRCPPEDHRGPNRPKSAPPKTAKIKICLAAKSVKRPEKCSGQNRLRSD